MMRRLALAACVAAIAGCASSGGEGRPETIRALLSADALLLSDFDTDRNFEISMAEVEAGVTASFGRADANADGNLSPIEFQHWSGVELGGGMTPPYRLDFDRNVDNIISEEEFRTELIARAQEYDADESGAVTRSELVRNLYQARPSPERAQRPAPGGPAPRN